MKVLSEMEVKLFELTKPLWVFSQICGLFPAIFTIADGKFGVLLVYFLRFYTATVFLSNFYLLVTYPSLDLATESEHVVYLTDSLCSLINNTTLLICIGYNCANLKKLVWLSDKFCKTGVIFRITYDSLETFVKIALCSAVFSWLVMLLTLKLVYKDWSGCLCDWFEFYFSSNVSDVHTVQFLFFVHLLKLHLAVIKGRLQNLRETPAAETCKIDTVSLLKKYHRKLFKIFNGIADVFSVPLLFTVANIFVAMFAELYFSTNGRALYNRSIFKPKYFSDFLITLVVFCKLTLKLITITKMCENVYGEQRDIKWILHGIKNEKNDPVLDKKLIDFSLQLIHENISFTAAGFFTIDNRLLRTVFSAVTIYLVILIQFDMTTTKKATM